MLKNITWNNIIKFGVALVIIIIFIIYKIITRDPADILLNHLENKYNKKFEIVLMGKRARGGFYQARVYPKELEKLGKVNDEYYWFDGFVRNGSASDNYGNVLLQLSANEYFLPKLEELFGKNVLPILKIDNIYSPKFTDFKKELADIKRTKELYNIDKYFPISGGIYIFGRVENDEDREWYRKQIYEFVQFMKQTGTFEYVDLRIVISDEKVLSYQFQNDNELKNKIVKLRLNSKNDKLFFKQRTELMKKIDINKVTKEEQQEILNSINKGNFIDGGFADFVGGNSIFYKKLYSPKYIESQNLDEELKVEYNNLDEMKFTWEMY